MLEMTNENFARLLRGLTFAVGKRTNRILLYQFLAAEIRAFHCSYGVVGGAGVVALGINGATSESTRLTELSSAGVCYGFHGLLRRLQC